MLGAVRASTLAQEIALLAAHSPQDVVDAVVRSPQQLLMGSVLHASPLDFAPGRTGRGQRGRKTCESSVARVRGSSFRASARAADRRHLIEATAARPRPKCWPGLGSPTCRLPNHPPVAALRPRLGSCPLARTSNPLSRAACYYAEPPGADYSSPPRKQELRTQ